MTSIEKDSRIRQVCENSFGTLRRGSGCTDSQALLKEVIPLVVTRRTIAEFTQSAARKDNQSNRLSECGHGHWTDAAMFRFLLVCPVATSAIVTYCRKLSRRKKSSTRRFTTSVRMR